MDASTKDTTVMALFSDLDTLVNDFTTESTLNTGAMITDYQGDSGIQTVFDDKNDFLFLEANFNVRYQDTLT
jgi:hypothetical protein